MKLLIHSSIDAKDLDKVELSQFATIAVVHGPSIVWRRNTDAVAVPLVESKLTKREIRKLERKNRQRRP